MVALRNLYTKEAKKPEAKVLSTYLILWPESSAMCWG